MGSTREKGKRFERRIKDYLISLGWTVDIARAAVHFVGPGKCFSSQCDFFGCADIVAIHSTQLYTLFIQAHAGEAFAKKRKDLENMKWGLTQRVQLWVPQNEIRQGIRVFNMMARYPDIPTWREFIFRMKNGEPPPEGIL